MNLKKLFSMGCSSKYWRYLQLLHELGLEAVDLDVGIFIKIENLAMIAFFKITLHMIASLIM